MGSIGVTTSIMDRYLGYYKAMLCAGLPLREEWLIPDRGPTEDRLSVSLPETDMRSVYSPAATGVSPGSMPSQESVFSPACSG